MNITGARPISVNEARELLEERSKESELEYEQLQAFEHAQKFSKYGKAETEKLCKLITEKYPNIDLELAQKLADISPKSPETLKAIVLRKRVDVSDEEAAGILGMLKK